VRWVGTPKPLRLLTTTRRHGAQADGKGAEKQPLVCPTTDTWLMADHEALDVNGTFAPKGNNGQKPKYAVQMRSFFCPGVLSEIPREKYGRPSTVRGAAEWRLRPRYHLIREEKRGQKKKVSLTPRECRVHAVPAREQCHHYYLPDPGPGPTV
jgi:hypothetical protein